MESIQTKRCGYYYSKGHAYAKGTWPLGKLEIYEDHLFLSSGFAKVEIQKNQITEFVPNWFGVQIEFLTGDEPSYIDIHGFKLKEILRNWY